MFVIFISFIFILNISDSRTINNNTVLIKEKLRKSVTYLKDLLFAIESKIQQEKTKLLQISYKFNQNQNPPAARMDTTVKPSSDVSMPKGNPHNFNIMQTTLETPAPMFTFATMFPTPPEDDIWPPTEMAYKSVMTDFPVFSRPKAVTSSTTESQFVKDMRKTMRDDNHNFFTAFLTRITELVAIKKPIDTVPVIKLLLVKLKEKVDTIIFDDEVGKLLTDALNRSYPMVSEMAPKKLQERAMVAHFTLKNKDKYMSPLYNRITDFYGQFFNRADGRKLFKALEAFYEYNNGRRTALEVTDMIMEAMINPYIRVKGPGIKTTVSAMNETTVSAINELTESVVSVTVSPVYNMKKYQVHATQFPVTGYREPVQVLTTKYEPSGRRNFEQNVKHFMLKRPKLLEKIKQHYGNIKKNKGNHLLSQKQRLDQNHRKSGTGQIDEHKQSRKRAHISSEEIYNRPKYFHDNFQNPILHKIREASSYSDEERHLKNNLYDALRHGNTTFVSFRKLGGDIIDKQTLRDLSSEPDEEWVLKNNIYKVFERKKD